MFDKEKVLTPFTADKAKVGDVGWIAHTLEGIVLQAQNQNDSISCDLIKVNSDIREIRKRFAFLGRRGGENVKGDFFYPAPYELQQEKWVEKVGLKVGDKVKLTRGWCKGEGGYDDFYRIFHEKGKVYTVTEIKPKHIKVDGEGYIALPYFALEKVAEEYRPFANGEEFEPHRDRWLKGDGEGCFRVFSYNNGHVYMGGVAKSYEKLCKEYTFADTGEPAGVKL